MCINFKMCVGYIFYFYVYMDGEYFFIFILILKFVIICLKCGYLYNVKFYLIWFKNLFYFCLCVSIFVYYCFIFMC